MIIRACKSSREGVALIIVIISVTVLAVLAFGFAYSMQVEMKLARNANSEAELEWLGRSGIEYCRWILAEQMRVPGENYTARNQVWAGGPGGPGTTNSALLGVRREVELGRGSFHWVITDLESKANVNAASEQLLQQAFNLMGVDPTDMTVLINSIRDWIDADPNTGIEGAEEDYYERLDPPYTIKNGPLDDISELLLIKGMTPELFWGAAYTNHPPGVFLRERFRNNNHVSTFNSGLVDLFAVMGTGRININTASAEVLQLVPGVDAMVAEAIVRGREGEDDGSGMFGPYRSVAQVFERVPEVNRGLMGVLSQYCDVRSRTFQIQVEAQIGGYRREFIAMVGCSDPRNIQLLTFYWK